MNKYKLSPEQSKIVNHIKGAILVLAPVGTGKTRVLAERVLRAIENGIPARKILCLTFTNRAGKEMTDRLARYCPSQFRYLTIKTFHGLCAAMLRIEARQIGLPADFVIYDDTDCIELVKEIFGLSKEKEAQQIFFDLAKCKSQASVAQLSSNYPLEHLYADLGAQKARLASRYKALLQQRHALDFADLVFYVRVMLHNHLEIRKRWQERFDFVQVDEVQDTHQSEYSIVHCLASQSGNLAMIGDLDQTIYAWRGSEPEKVISQFRHNFKPTEYSLTWNFRATKTLLKAASAFADSFEQRQTKITPAPDCKQGELIQVHLAQDEWAEAQWIGKQIQKLASGNPNFVYNRVAVLARTHKRIEIVSQVLNQLHIPCTTVEQFQFFMRQEVKDALAYLRLLLNPFDASSMRRILMRPNRGIGSATIENVITKGQDCGFKLTDMASSQTFIDGDPFSPLLAAYTSGKIVVFDVETTGFSTSEDEVVEIAAARLINSRVEAKFQAYIANTVSVGSSEQIHGYSDKFLARNGRPATEVFQEFLNFTGDSLLVGHNVGFDIKMVQAHARKVGMALPKFQWADTWNLATRFIEADSYNLEALAEKLNLAQFPNHNAMEDTLTTVELLTKLIPFVRLKADYRQALVYRYGNEFAGLAEQIDNWRDASQELRPAQLLNKVIEESGLYSYYQFDEKRRQNLLHLVQIFQNWDIQKLHPETVLRRIIDYTALAKNLDQVSQDDNQVPVITIHQSKGLEFDTVFIAGASEDEFPGFYHVQNDDLEEEKRLFYVAMTRAQKQLFISAFLRDSKGYSKSFSQFIGTIPEEYINE
jgi:DNA helicase-2/ATP-dependent DNA helicase PcrA